MKILVAGLLAVQMAAVVKAVKQENVAIAVAKTNAALIQKAVVPK